MNQPSESHPIKLKPIISYPREAQVSRSYLMTIDVQLEAPDAPWPYPEEEYVISFVLDLDPYFHYEPLGGREPSVVLHRFGGTYGPAEYLLTAAGQEMASGNIHISLVNGWGLPMAHMELQCEIKHELIPDLQRETMIVRKDMEATTAVEQQASTTDQPSGAEERHIAALPDLGEVVEEHDVEWQLKQAGWSITEELDKYDSTTRGIAVHISAPLPFYILVVDGESAGIINVNPLGDPLAKSESPIPAFPIEGSGNQLIMRKVFSFVYETTGVETRFTNYLEPEPRSRRVFSFHRPETLALWLEQAPAHIPATQSGLLRSRLRRMPLVPQEEFSQTQFEAITSIEQSLAANNPRTLIQMAIGTGKTHALVGSVYRLLRSGGARRVLYLAPGDDVQYVYNVFQSYISPDGFYEHMNYPLSRGATIQPDASIYITSLEGLYLSFLGIGTSEQIVGSITDDFVSYPLQIQYNPTLPIEAFDIIILHDIDLPRFRSFQPLLEYFDAFIVGVMNDVDKRIPAYFNDNLVYTQFNNISRAQAIVDLLWRYTDTIQVEKLPVTDYLEQLTYLLFLKIADELVPPYYQLSPILSGYTWQNLLTKEGNDLRNHYSNILKELGQVPGVTGLIFNRSQNKFRDPTSLRHIIDLIDKIWIDLDTRAASSIYEGLLEKNVEVSRQGSQHTTPRALVQAIIDVMRPEPGTTICDPACGYGGFLVAAYEHMADPEAFRSRETGYLLSRGIHGWEVSHIAARFCTMNLLLHDIFPINETINPPITIADSLSFAPGNRYDMILAHLPSVHRGNPTYVNSREQLTAHKNAFLREDFWMTTADGDLAFLQHIYSLLDMYGRAAVIVPGRVLFRGQRGGVVRSNLLQKCDLHTILRLPAHTLYDSDVPAAVLFFDKMPPASDPWTKRLWVYDMHQQFDPRTHPLTRADFDDFVASFKLKRRHQRQESRNFRPISYDRLINRSGANLNILWSDNDEE